MLLLQVIDKSFGFDTAVEEAQRAINAAHVESESFENCIGVVKLMGRYSGKVLSFLARFCSSIIKSLNFGFYDARVYCYVRYSC